jgi:hypothetical protein
MRRLVLIVASVLLTAVAGCSPASPASSASAGSQQLPSPGAGPDSALLPPAAPLPLGGVSHAAVALAAQAASGGTAGLAALRTALAMSGFALTDVGGKVAVPAQAPAMGVDIPVGQVLALNGRNGTDHGETLSQIAATLAVPVAGHVSQAALVSTLQAGVTAAAAPGAKAAPPARFLAAFITSLGPYDSSGPLTTMQTWLTYLGLASAFWQRAVAARAAGSKAALPAVTVAPASLLAYSDSGGDCTISDTAGKILDVAAAGLNFLAGGVSATGFGGLAGVISKAGEAKRGAGQVYEAGDYVAWANIALSLAHIIAEATSFQGDMQMDGGEPLIRTKETHGYDERRTLTLHARFNIGKGQYANCFRTAINTAGLDFSVPNDGPITKAKVSWTMDNDPAGVLSNPTEFYLLAGSKGNGVVTVTDDGGQTRVGLEGLPQRHKVPDSVQPFIRHVHITAGITVRANNMFNDLVDAVSTVLAGPGAAASIVSNMIDHTGSFTISKSFQVKDWPKDFRIHAALQDSGGTSGIVTGLKCDGVAGEWVLRSGGGSLSFTLNDQGQGTTPGDLGPVPVRLVISGDSATLEWKSRNVQQKLAVEPGDFCKD